MIRALPFGIHIRATDFRKFAYRDPYLDPKRLQNNGPKPLKPAQKAIMLHTCGVQGI